MSWARFLLFLFCGITWGALMLTLIWNSCRILHYNHLALCIFWSECFTDHFYFTRGYTCVWIAYLIGFNFGKWYILGKLSFSFSFSNLVESRFLKYVLRILWISSVLVVMSKYSFLVVLIWIFSFYLLFFLEKSLSKFLIFKITISLFYCFF